LAAIAENKFPEDMPSEIKCEIYDNFCTLSKACKLTKEYNTFRIFSSLRETQLAYEGFEQLGSNDDERSQCPEGNDKCTVVIRACGKASKLISECSCAEAGYDEALVGTDPLSKFTTATTAYGSLAAKVCDKRLLEAASDLFEKAGTDPGTCKPSWYVGAASYEDLVGKNLLTIGKYECKDIKNAVATFTQVYMCCVFC